MKPWNDSDAGADPIDQLVYLSNLIGSDLALVQPGGGNTSVKIEETDLFGNSVQSLVVKGSGTDLRTIEPDGFTHLYLDRLAVLRERDAMSDEEMMALMRACMLFADRDPVPSVETPLHSILPHRFVAHTHDIASLSLTDTPSAREHVQQALGDDVAFLEYVRPGFPLAKRMAEQFRDGPPPGAIGLAMEKHGFAAWGKTAKECHENLTSIIFRAERYAGERRGKGSNGTGPKSVEHGWDLTTAATIALIIRGALTSGGYPSILTFDGDPDLIDAISHPGYPELAARGVMTPEHILRAGVRPLVLDPSVVGARHASPLRDAVKAAHDSYLEYAAANDQPNPIPDWLKVIAVPGLGAFFASKDRRYAMVARDCYRATLEVQANAEAIESFQFLSEADACEMEYWPLERRKIEESAKSRKPLEGKIALIIGGAGAISRATALRFAAEGAHIALADLDAGRAEAVAAEINALNPERAIGVGADAALAESVDEAVRRTVRQFGGLDILFYSPGIAPELHPVSEMDDAEVRRQLAINYEGAVAATRAASRVMLAQGTGGRLIYNASKAAFAPGEGAAAYGASKAALAHYVRNTANELSRHGITANYINADAIDTPLFRKLVTERSVASGQTEAQTLERYTERSIFRTATVPAESVAEAALWLASDGAQFTSGCVITVGGGAEGMPR